MGVRRSGRGRVVLAGVIAGVLAGASGVRAADWTVDVPAGSRGDVAVATAAVQKAIDACGEAGGGRVVVLAGEYVVAPIQLRSNVELHLERGATLRFSRKFEDYPLVWIDIGNGPEPGSASPIGGDKLTNVALTGEGTIDGQGDAWRMVKRSKLTEAQWADLVRTGGVTDEADSREAKTWYPNEVVRDHAAELMRMVEAKPTSLEPFAPYRALLRPRLVRFMECRGVRIEGLTFKNGANWNLHLCLSDDITVRNVTVKTDAWAQNGDGIDFDSCRNVTLTDSNFEAGDDGICLKSGRDAPGRLRGRPTENVTIARCRVGTGHGGVVIGSEMSGGVRNVTVTDCAFEGTDNGLRFKSTRGRGGTVENVRVDRVTMRDIEGVAVLFDLYYASNGKPGPATDKPNETTPQFRDFKISNVNCDGAKVALQLRGLPEQPLSEMTFENVRIKAEKPGFVTDVKDVVLRGVRVEAKEPVKVQDGAGVRLEDCSGFGK